MNWPFVELHRKHSLGPVPLISHNTLALSFDKSATVVPSFHLVGDSRLMLVCACMSLCMQIFGTGSSE